MSFDAYPAYRDSGAAWLRDVPENWKVLPAKAVFAERKRPSLPDDTHLTPSQKHGVLAQSEYMALTGNKVVLNLTGSDAMRHVEPRDFISHLRSFQGGLELSQLRGKVSAAYTVLVPRSGVVASYFKHLFKSTMYVQALQTTTDQLRDGQSIRYAQFALIPIPVPSSAEQRQIADYLDAQTAKIDALIGKQERLIETLAERRQAVISRAVTKGLDPNVPMGRAANPRLGMVPLHWRSGRLKNVLHGPIVDGPHTTPEFLAEGRPFLSVDAIQNGELNLDGCRHISEEDFREFRLKAAPAPDDLLLGKAASTGKVARVKTEIAFAIWSPLALIRLTRNTVAPRYVEYQLKSTAVQAEIEDFCTANTQKNISMTDIPRLRMVFPPIDEQEAIADHLDGETARIDHLSAKAREMIDVLKERRQALISAAVTGKIDVRGLA